MLMLALIFTSCSVSNIDSTQTDTTDIQTSDFTESTSDDAIPVFGGEIVDAPDTSESEETTGTSETTGLEDTTAAEDADFPEETTVAYDTSTEDTTGEDTTSTQVDTKYSDVSSKEFPDVTAGAKIIYMTFDDGPGRFTNTVLEILAEYDITATFFLVGNFVSKYPERVRAIADAGHTIGCHSMSHAYGEIYASPEAISADVELWESAVYDALGYIPGERLYRFPGGSTCTAVKPGTFGDLFGALKDKGYTVYDWSCANNDAWYVNMREDQTKEEFFMESLQNSLKVCGNVRILLLHETVSESVGLLREMIEYMIAEGYTFMPLDYYKYDYVFRH